MTAERARRFAEQRVKGEEQERAAKRPKTESSSASSSSSSAAAAFDPLEEQVRAEWKQQRVEHWTAHFIRTAVMRRWVLTHELEQHATECSHAKVVCERCTHPCYRRQIAAHQASPECREGMLTHVCRRLAVLEREKKEREELAAKYPTIAGDFLSDGSYRRVYAKICRFQPKQFNLVATKFREEHPVLPLEWEQGSRLEEGFNFTRFTLQPEIGIRRVVHEGGGGGMTESRFLRVQFKATTADPYDWVVKATLLYCAHPDDHEYDCDIGFNASRRPTTADHERSVSFTTGGKEHRLEHEVWLLPARVFDPTNPQLISNTENCFGVEYQVWRRPSQLVAVVAAAAQ